ncbi:MAG TPA: LPS export ABC transporter periplasmic protein LptC [Xanthobacteraceae bacterium]|nr:LPS export ABC transporter periplasmic protein LptC [Xanthobacteraceae bacterium]
MNRHVAPPIAPPQVLRASGLAAGARLPDFRAALRHSRRVRFFRRAVPVTVLAGLGFAVAFAYFDPLKIAVDLPFDLGRVSLSGSRVMMELPKLSGFTDDKRGYSVSAKSASQDLTNPQQIDLVDIQARLELADKGWARVTAQSGNYNTKSEQMVLADGIKVDTSAGYAGRMQQARIDVRAGTMVSDQPVELSYLDGKLTADRLEISQKDARALLTGHVQLLFRIPESKADGAPAAPAHPPATSGSTP